MSKGMLVAVQSPDGTKRIQCLPSDTTYAFMKMVQSAFQFGDTEFDLYKQRNKQGHLSLERKRLSDYGIQHGDTMFLSFKSQHSNSSNNDAHVNLTEDEVDTFLHSQECRIQRERDAKLCHHGPHGKCIHCVPVEPYDENYLKEQNIKHMSFHSYLRKITGGADKGKYAALENIRCKIKEGCKEHPPWPKGICTKCQPNPLTLNRQVYRHVDNVVFENPFLVERFLNYWRITGHQRIGFLYGRYEFHKDVPLGIKATVAAIYEPPQDASRDCVKLLPDLNSNCVEKIAKRLGLVKVGWIFTDLIAEDLQKGTVKHLRNISSHFLSAQECVTAGDFQNKHPNVCKLSPDGFFGSKFLTVIFTGDAENHVHMEGYQVSNQCMALVKDKCLVPTLDAPELGYVKESGNEQYVPDVFYKVKDSYGNEVTQLARPLPIEYLLVDVPVSTPNEPQFTFYADATITPFPVENRLVDGHIHEGLRHLAAYLRQFNPTKFLEAVSDFHVLLFLATNETLPLLDTMDPLLDAVRTKDRDAATEWSRSEEWATIEHIVDAEGMWGPGNNAPVGGQPALNNLLTGTWVCAHCTYLNQPLVTTCEMCRLPK